MKIEKKILTGTAVLGLGEAIGQVANFSFVILFARQFGSEALGHYSLAMSVGAVACIFISLGAHDLLTREIGQAPHRGQQLVTCWLPVEVGNALIVWTAIAAGAALIELDTSLRLTLLIIGAYQILWHLSGLFALQFSARGEMLIPAVVGGGHRLIVLVLALLLMLLNADSAVSLLAFPLAAIVAVCVLAIKTRKTFGVPAANQAGVSIRQILRRCWPFLVLTVLTVIQIRIGIILLAAMDGAAAAGIYAAADRLILPVFMIQGLLVAAAYPALLNLWAGDHERMKVVALRCLRIMMLFSISIGGIIFVFRADIIRVAFGAEFSESIAILAILAWLPVIQGLRSLLEAQAITAHLHGTATLIKVLALAILIAGGALLIGRIGASGLAIAVLASEIVYATLLLALLAHRDLAPRIAGLFIGPICAVGLAGITASTLGGHGVFVRLPITIALTILGLLLFRSVRLHDIRYLAAILRMPASSNG